MKNTQLKKVLEKHQPKIVAEKAMDLMRRLDAAPPGITSEWKLWIKEVAAAAYEMAEALKMPEA